MINKIEGHSTVISTMFVLDYFKDLDTLRPKRVSRHHHNDGTFRIGNQDPRQGKKAIEEVLATFFEDIKSMNHNEIGIWLGQNSAVFQAEVAFILTNDSWVTIPAVSIMRMIDKKVKDLRMVMDAASLNKNQISEHAKKRSYGILDYMAARCRTEKE